LIYYNCSLQYVNDIKENIIFKNSLVTYIYLFHAYFLWYKSVTMKITKCLIIWSKMSRKFLTTRKLN